MTLFMQIFGWSLIAVGFMLIRTGGGLPMGASGAILIGLAQAGAFNTF